MSKRPFTIGEELKRAGVPGMDTGLEQIEYIPIDKIDPDDRNFYSVDDVSELAASIELVGLQQPLRVRSGERGHVTVVSGHRRRAAILLIRDGGSTMFERGVPCIRERGDVSKEWQELKLIYGNSATRILTASEISIQSEKVTEILGKLEEQGVKFPGRTRDHVAAILQTSKSRVGRLHAIRANLVPELLQEFDGGGLGETVAYRLSQEDAAVQHDLAARLGPAVRGLTGDSAEKVLGQIKQPLVTKPPEPDPNKAIDGLKRYLDEREKEDREFWHLMQKIADDVLMRSFSAGAGLNRKKLERQPLHLGRQQQGHGHRRGPEDHPHLDGGLRRGGCHRHQSVPACDGGREGQAEREAQGGRARSGHQTGMADRCAGCPRLVFDLGGVRRRRPELGSRLRDPVLERKRMGRGRGRARGQGLRGARLVPAAGQNGEGGVSYVGS